MVRSSTTMRAASPWPFAYRPCQVGSSSISIAACRRAADLGHAGLTGVGVVCFDDIRIEPLLPGEAAAATGYQSVFPAGGMPKR